MLRRALTSALQLCGTSASSSGSVAGAGPSSLAAGACAYLTARFAAAAQPAVVEEEEGEAGRVAGPAAAELL